MFTGEQFRKQIGMSREDFERTLWELEAAGIVKIRQFAEGKFAVNFTPAFLEEIDRL